MVFMLRNLYKVIVIIWLCLSGVVYDSLRRVDGEILLGLVWIPGLLCGECVSCILSQVVPSQTLVIWVGARQEW